VAALVNFLVEQFADAPWRQGVNTSRGLA
jgi:hypothetical protein